MSAAAARPLNGVLANPRPASLFWSAVLAIAVVLAGSLAGHHAARELARQQALSELDTIGQRLLTRFEQISREAFHVFAELEGLNNEPCSDEELLAMRTRVFNARFLRDIGRVQDGRTLLCSTSLGRLEIPYESATGPDIRIAHEMGVRTDRAVMAGEDTRTMVVETRSFNALVDPAVITDLSEAIDSAQLFLRPLGASGELADWHPFQREWTRFDTNLISERCSEEFGLCIQLRLPKSWSGSADTELRFAMAGLGGIAGLALFLVFLVGLRHEGTPERRLARAIADNQIRPVYQPIYKLPEGHLVGLEALARWHDSHGDQIPTEEFIALAEESGMITKITDLMIRRVGEELSTWLTAHPDRFISINIAPAELGQKRLLDRLENELIGRGLTPEQVVLEITERSMVDNQEAAHSIERLSRRGFRVYADDFGVGYCGLAYLNDIDVHGIKISDLFTAAVATDSPKAALVPRITELAREMGLDVIIEGVETPEQAESLAALGPVLVQGWLYSKAVDIEALRKELSDQEASAVAPKQ